ncbi:MAG: transcription antitermination factor NusB [Parachlamydiaceae bacterium]|nr:transcription antitermination factor NusB [Parachlamydiaceae bacterium]
MAIPQQKMRELVFQMLYSHDVGHVNETDMVAFLMAELSVTRQAVKQAQERVRQLLTHQTEIDALITQNTSSYEFDRIHSVERNVLRLGVFELLYDDAIPPKVAIAEALRLAKKFGSPESVSFVNAIIDGIYQKSAPKQQPD